MFSPLNPATSKTQRKILAASVVAHGLLLVWMLHTPEPQLLMPESIRLGRNGKALTQLYWNTQTPDDSTTSSSQNATEVYRHQRLARKKLILQKNSQLAKLTAPQIPLSPSSTEDKSKTQTLSNLGHGAPAGLPYGTLGRGPLYGEEVRPALPITTSDPVVYPWELPDSEGNVIVEITIDERGEIVRKTVLQSMGQKLDEKFLVALENWHFHPATRNGIAIASKGCSFSLPRSWVIAA
jgi:TonB family protein